mmetsp:Transcript_25388/g.35600  ORF Transcript_25388/g.35600 Transcript_25388/m.35600 type:complete len:89 (-) Transcript_25388:11-277(-)
MIKQLTNTFLEVFGGCQHARLRLQRLDENAAWGLSKGFSIHLHDGALLDFNFYRRKLPNFSAMLQVSSNIAHVYDSRYSKHFNYTIID